MARVGGRGVMEMGAMEEAKADAIQMCSVRASAGQYGIDTRAVREVLGTAQLRRVPLSPGYVAGVTAYRGEVLTLVSLRALLGLEAQCDAQSVLVLEDEESGEPFGLMVDGVGGVVSVAKAAMERNPSTLGAREAALFQDVCRMSRGLMVRLDARRLRPAELARSGLFDGEAKAG